MDSPKPVDDAEAVAQQNDLDVTEPPGLSTPSTDHAATLIPREKVDQRPAADPEEGLHGTPALLAMSGIALVVLLAALDQTIVGTALPRIVAELHGFSLYAWVATSYLLTSTVMVPIMGKLGDLYGRKGFLLVAIVIFVAASAAAGAATTMLFLIIARGVQGIGAGMLQATAFTSVGDMFPQPERRARWQGIITGTFGLASVVGPTLGGIMTDTLGWRSVFYVNLPVGIVAILVLWLTLPANLSPRTPNARIDWAGAATISLSVSALLLAVEWGGETLPWSSPTIIGLLIFSLVLLVVFIVIERRAREPLMPLDLFILRPIAICSILSVLIGFVIFGLVFYSPLLAQGAMGLSPSAAGAILTPLVVCQALGSLTSSQTFARLRRTRVVMLIGSGVAVLGTALLTQTTIDTNSLWFSVELALCGLGIGSLLPMVTIIVQSTVPRRRLGVGTSTIQFLRLIGSTLGTAIIGALVNGIFAAQLVAHVPFGSNPQLVAALTDPQALISPDALAQAQALAQQIGPNGQAQLQQLLTVSRDALASGVRVGFYLALAAMVLIFGLVFFLRDVVGTTGGQRVLERHEPDLL